MYLCLVALWLLLSASLLDSVWVFASNRNWKPQIENHKAVEWCPANNKTCCLLKNLIIFYIFPLHSSDLYKQIKSNCILLQYMDLKNGNSLSFSDGPVACISSFSIHTNRYFLQTLDLIATNSHFNCADFVTGFLPPSVQAFSVKSHSAVAVLWQSPLRHVSSERAPLGWIWNLHGEGWKEMWKTKECGGLVP